MRPGSIGSCWSQCHRSWNFLVRCKVFGKIMLPAYGSLMVLGN